MTLIAFTGATCFEAQVGVIWVRVLRPNMYFIPYRHFLTKKYVFPQVVCFGIDRTNKGN